MTEQKTEIKKLERFRMELLSLLEKGLEVRLTFCSPSTSAPMFTYKIPSEVFKKFIDNENS